MGTFLVLLLILSYSSYEGGEGKKEDEENTCHDRGSIFRPNLLAFSTEGPPNIVGNLHLLFYFHTMIVACLGYGVALSAMSKNQGLLKQVAPEER